MDDLLRRRKGAKRPLSLCRAAMFLHRNRCLAGSLVDLWGSTLGADRQPDPQTNQPRLRRAHEINPRPDRMHDERERPPEDSEVEPEPSDQPRFRS